jgi:hypothetical protein
LPYSRRIRQLEIDSATPPNLYVGTSGGSVWRWIAPFFADGFEPGDACAWTTTFGGGCP